LCELDQDLEPAEVLATIEALVRERLVRVLAVESIRPPIA
jgi:hypothetical protein